MKDKAVFAPTITANKKSEQLSPLHVAPRQRNTATIRFVFKIKGITINANIMLIYIALSMD